MTEPTTSVGEHAVVADHVNEILHSKAMPDLHALAWVQPFFNKLDSNWDPGWSCRDHTAVLAAGLVHEFHGALDAGLARPTRISPPFVGCVAQNVGSRSAPGWVVERSLP